MSFAETARALRALADRFERLQPLNHDPERYFVDRGEAVAELRKIADDLAPARGNERAERSGKFTPGAIEHRGRRIPVETRGARAARKPAGSDEIKKVFG